MSAYWLSFANPLDRSAILADEESFRGCVIVYADSFEAALMECSVRKLNPGGECMVYEIPPEIAAHILKKWKNRLLTRAECDQFDREIDEPILGVNLHEAD